MALSPAARALLDYLGPDARFPPMDEPPPGVVTHITVESVGGTGAWTP
jgi:hypothetical protein